MHIHTNVRTYVHTYIRTSSSFICCTLGLKENLSSLIQNGGFHDYNIITEIRMYTYVNAYTVRFEKNKRCQIKVTCNNS